MAWQWQPGGGGAQEYRPGYWYWVPDPYVPPAQPAPSPSNTSTGSSGSSTSTPVFGYGPAANRNRWNINNAYNGGNLFEVDEWGDIYDAPYRLGSYDQVGMIGGPQDRHPDLVSINRSSDLTRGGLEQGNLLVSREQADRIGQARATKDALKNARIDLLYGQNLEPVQSLYGKIGNGLTQSQFDQYFSEDALMKEIDRLTQPDDDSGFTKFMNDLGDHGTIKALTMMALAWMGGQAGAAMMGGGAANAGAIEAGTAGAEGAAMESAALNTNALNAGAAAGRAGASYAMTGDAKTAGLAAAVPAAMTYGADLAAPYVNDAMGYLRSGLSAGEDAGLATDELRRQGMLQVADADLSMTDVGGPLMPPAIVQPPAVPLMPPALTPEALTPLMPPAVQDVAALSQTGLQLPELDPGMLSMPPAQPEQQDPTAPEQQPAPEQPAQPTVTSQDLQRYIKVGKTLYEMLGQEEGSMPEGAPERGEDESAEEYAGKLGGYLGLDAEAMAEAGLEPGSPEYLQFIMDAADAAIAQALEGLDVDAEDFAQQLRTKTDAELLQLQRALYVRGQMDQLMGSGVYEDPATGTAEEVIGNGMFNPGAGAYQRGIARNVGELAGRRGSDALAYLNSWLGRDVDFYGMQGQADARYQEALREEELRRRGMFSY